MKGMPVSLPRRNKKEYSWTLRTLRTDEILLSQILNKKIFTHMHIFFIFIYVIMRIYVSEVSGALKIKDGGWTHERIRHCESHT